MHNLDDLKSAMMREPFDILKIQYIEYMTDTEPSNLLILKVPNKNIYKIGYMVKENGYYSVYGHIIVNSLANAILTIRDSICSQTEYTLDRKVLFANKTVSNRIQRDDTIDLTDMLGIESVPPYYPTLELIRK
jgi:hypothetical protein